MASQPWKEPRLPAPEESDWRRRFDALWGLSRRGVPLPPDGDWEARCALKPFERNLLRNPNPEGVNISEPAPPCPPDAPCRALDYAGCVLAEAKGIQTHSDLVWAARQPVSGLFEGWQVSTEPVAAASKEVPPKFESPCYSWCVKQQCVDLLAEGFWPELLDLYQPNITVLDWYEDSKVADSVYELHVQLLGTDQATVIGEFRHVARKGEPGGGKMGWHSVSHVFQRYGPGVRHVRFLHKTKDTKTPAGLLRTRATDSSVSVQLRD